MSRRNRKLFGAVTMLLFLGAYAYLALKVAELQALQLAPPAVQAICFAVLGIAWALPLMPLIWWMERGDATRTDRAPPFKRR